MKKLLCLISIMMISSVSVVFANNISVTVNNEKISFSSEPIIKDGTTLVPMRQIFEALDANVEWLAETKQIKATEDDKEIVLTIGSKTAIIDGISTPLAKAPEIINNNTYVPTRFIAESLGANVDWEQSTKTVIITTEDEPEDDIPKEEGVYSSGVYMIGKDIPAGFYEVELTNNTAYIARLKDLDLETESIIANEFLTGNSYVEILPTDFAISARDANLKKVDLSTMEKDIKTEISKDGTYLVGYDLEPGIYNVSPLDASTEGGVIRLKDAKLLAESIIENRAVSSNTTIEIKENDFSVELKGVKITKL